MNLSMSRSYKHFRGMIVLIAYLYKKPDIRKFTRKATAKWKGTGKGGSGTLSTQSTVLDGTQYSYKTRFEDGVGTNPEEMIGSATARRITRQVRCTLHEQAND